MSEGTAPGEPRADEAGDAARNERRLNGPEALHTPLAVVDDLERRFVVEPLEVTAFSRTLDLMAPRSAEDLLSEEDFDRDERLPYWADLWPSSYALADRLASESGRVAGAPLRLLELGCGLGLVTIAALTAGFDVLATDYYADALLFTRANSWRVLGADAPVRLVDWRSLPADLGTFDRVVAADVLYERRYTTIVADALARTLSPCGTALVADPGRTAITEFLRECEARGLMVASVESWRYAEGNVRQTILVHELVWGGGAGEREK